MEATIKQIKEKIAFLEKNKNTLMIDADTHLTDLEKLAPPIRERLRKTENYYHGRPIGVNELLAEMKMSEVDMCLIWQNPAATRYTSDKRENFEALLQANRYISEMAARYPEKFISAGWIDPVALETEDAVQLINICIREFGFPFVKMNPAQNSYPIDSPVVFEMVQKITEQGAVPAFHFGADTQFTPLSGLVNIAKAFPENPVLVVHMGGGGAGYVEAEHLYSETREAGLLYPNLKFIQSAKRDTHMESDFITYQLAGEPFSSNIFCGSDAPYGRMSWNFGGFRAMFQTLMSNEHTDWRIKNNPGLFSPETARKYLGGNLAELAIETYRSLLKNIE